MKIQRRSRLNAFPSLDWYEVALRFLFSFVAKTSEVLLAAGLVVSTANFLTDGSLLATYPNVSVAWAWAQALAIDSSLGVSLASTFQYLKQGAWIKGLLYGLLTLLLAFVAGAITTVDIVSHALHITTGGAMLQMDLNISMVSRLRAIAVIGFMLMSRIRDLPLQDLLVEEEPDSQLASSGTGTSHPKASAEVVVQSLLSQFSAQEVAQIVNACVASGVIAPVHSQRVVPSPQAGQREYGPGGTVSSETPGDNLSDPGVSASVELSFASATAGGTVPGLPSVPEIASSSQIQIALEPLGIREVAVAGERTPLPGTGSQPGSSEERRPDSILEGEPSLEPDQRLE